MSSIKSYRAYLCPDLHINNLNMEQEIHHYSDRKNIIYEFMILQKHWVSKQSEAVLSVRKT